MLQPPDVCLLGKDVKALTCFKKWHLRTYIYVRRPSRPSRTLNTSRHREDRAKSFEKTANITLRDTNTYNTHVIQAQTGPNHVNSIMQEHFRRQHCHLQSRGSRTAQEGEKGKLSQQGRFEKQRTREDRTHRKEGRRTMLLSPEQERRVQLDGVMKVRRPHLRQADAVIPDPAFRHQGHAEDTIRQQ